MSYAHPRRLRRLGGRSNATTLDVLDRRRHVIDTLLARSAELDEKLSSVFALQPAIQAPRMVAARAMCDIAFEHGVGVRQLIAAQLTNSAFALMRVQYEALVRGYWLRAAAPDDAIQILLRDLQEESTERLPMVTEMLKQLQGKLPPGVTSHLAGFRMKLLTPLNSAVHSGGHAFQRGVVGYLEASARGALLNANGLQWTCAFLVADLAQEPHAVSRLYGWRVTYEDCLPPSDV